MTSQPPSPSASPLPVSSYVTAVSWITALFTAPAHVAISILSVVLQGVLVLGAVILLVAALPSLCAWLLGSNHPVTARSESFRDGARRGLRLLARELVRLMDPDSDMWAPSHTPHGISPAEDASIARMQQSSASEDGDAAARARQPPVVRLRKAWHMPADIAKELASLIDYIIRDFVLPWYAIDDVGDGISVHTHFLECVQTALTDVFGNLGFRIAHINPALLVLDDVLHALHVHLGWYAEMTARAERRYPDLFTRVVRLDQLPQLCLSHAELIASLSYAQLQSAVAAANMSTRDWMRLREEAQQRALLQEYARESEPVLHPAIQPHVREHPILCGVECELSSTRFVRIKGPVMPPWLAREQQHFRDISSQVLPRLLPEKDAPSMILVTLLREIVGCVVLQPALSNVDPDLINFHLLRLLNRAAAASAATSDVDAVDAGLRDAADAAASTSMATSSAPGGSAAPRGARTSASASPPFRASSAPQAPAGSSVPANTFVVAAVEHDFDDVDAMRRKRDTAKRARTSSIDSVPLHSSMGPSDPTSSASAYIVDEGYRYFAGSISRPTAEAILAGAGIGTFLLRAKEGGVLVLSYVRAAEGSVEIAHTLVKLSAGEEGGGFTVLQRGPFSTLAASLRACRDIVWLGVTSFDAAATVTTHVTESSVRSHLADIGEAGDAAPPQADAPLHAVYTVHVELLYSLARRLTPALAVSGLGYTAAVQALLARHDDFIAVAATTTGAETVFAPQAAAVVMDALRRGGLMQLRASTDMAGSGTLTAAPPAAASVAPPKSLVREASVDIVAMFSRSSSTRALGRPAPAPAPAAAPPGEKGIFNVLGPLFSRAVALQRVRASSETTPAALEVVAPGVGGDEDDLSTWHAIGRSDVDLASDEENAVENEWVRAGSFAVDDAPTAAPTSDVDAARLDAAAAPTSDSDNDRISDDDGDAHDSDGSVDDEDRLPRAFGLQAGRSPSAHNTPAMNALSSSLGSLSGAEDLSPLADTTVPVTRQASVRLFAPTLVAPMGGLFTEPLFGGGDTDDAPVSGDGPPAPLSREASETGLTASSHHRAPTTVLAQHNTFARHKRRWHRHHTNKATLERTAPAAGSDGTGSAETQLPARPPRSARPGTEWLLESDSSGGEDARGGHRNPSSASRSVGVSTPTRSAVISTTVQQSLEATIQSLQRQADGGPAPAPAAPTSAATSASVASSPSSISRTSSSSVRKANAPAEEVTPAVAVVVPSARALDFFGEVLSILDVQHAPSVQSINTPASVGATSGKPSSWGWNRLSRGVSSTSSAPATSAVDTLSPAGHADTAPSASPLDGMVVKVVRASLRDEVDTSAVADREQGATSVVRYVVAVRFPTPDRTGVYAWTVRHRYSEFLELMEHIRDATDETVAACALFPPKRSFSALVTSKTNQDFVVTRQNALDAWLQAIISSPRLRACAEVRMFVAPQSQSAVTCTGEAARAALAAEKAAKSALRRARASSVKKVSFVPPSTLDVHAVGKTAAVIAAAPTSAKEDASGVAAAAPSTSADAIPAGAPAPAAGLPSLQFLSIDEFERAEGRLFRILNDVFGLHSYAAAGSGASGWVKRNIIGVTRTLFGLLFRGSTAKAVSAAYTDALSARANAGYLHDLLEIMWPGGVKGPPGVPRTWEEQWRMRECGRDMVCDRIPPTLASLLGRTTLEHGVHLLHAFCQQPALLKSLVYSVVDAALLRVFPGLRVPSVHALMDPDKLHVRHGLARGAQRMVASVAAAPVRAARAVASMTGLRSRRPKSGRTETSSKAAAAAVSASAAVAAPGSPQVRREADEAVTAAVTAAPPARGFMASARALTRMFSSRK